MNDNAKPAKAFRQPRPLCYYGDDFTGSTDVLEALFRAGLRAVLFLDTPSPEELEERFAEVDCFGIAGIGRSLPPEAMERELRPIFEVLRSAGAVVVHYKICSTFDSSPGIGSIGRVAEVGRSVFGGRYIPLIAGVPYLRRFTVFGHHFAAGGMDIYRLDRHPTMSRHPATPMEESDLLLHLQKQTDMPTALMDVVSLDGDLDEARSRLEELIR
ncbi:four-carbon acid sugar kinase family protein, partial [Paenibacillus sepulcri]|nr:four-carbon acid sugar kinase family protein [Paenibacillus sepulcri]